MSRTHLRLRRLVRGRCGADHGRRDRAAVSLTFDDGPSAHTIRILEVLREYAAVGTFFQTGTNVLRAPRVALAVAEAGQEIGVHGWSHDRLTRANAGEELGGARRAISETTGSHPITMRAPYGDCSRSVCKIGAALGLTSVLWDVDTRDWHDRDPAAIVGRTLRNVQSGSIVLLHDGGADRNTTVEATRMLVPALLGRGYALVGVVELLELGDPGRASSTVT